MLAATLSGCAALIYNTCWTRTFGLILGTTVKASSVSFAGFLLGLGLGAFLWTKLSHHFKNKHKAYAVLEILAALSSSIIGFLLMDKQDILSSLLLPSQHSFFIFQSISLLILIIIIPSLLLGATFPALMDAVNRHLLASSKVAYIYGANTVGASIGAFLTGFIFIRQLGITDTYLMGVGFNFLSAFLVLGLHKNNYRNPVIINNKIHTHPITKIKENRDYSLLICILATEIILIRYSIFYMGNRVFAFTTTLSAILLVLGLASWLSQFIFKSKLQMNPHKILSLLYFSSMIGIVICAYLTTLWIEHSSAYEKILPYTSVLLIFYRFLICLLLVSLALLPLGMILPTVMSRIHQINTNTAQIIGKIYFSNTLGSIIGSLGIGYIALNQLGMVKSLWVLIFLISLLTIFHLYKSYTLNGIRKIALLSPLLANFGAFYFRRRRYP